MASGDDPTALLREALRHSPDNVPLRRHLIDQLIALGRHDEAEAELRETLRLVPGDWRIRLKLAEVYQALGKLSQALVVTEDMTRAKDCPAAAFVLYAKLLLSDGDVPNAVAQYKLALEIDPSCEDEALSDRLGVRPPTETMEDPILESDDEVVEGRVRHSIEPIDDPDTDVERPSLGFDDVGGMAELKEEISLKIIYPLQHPEVYQAYGKKIGGGILMYGPPGCGKTYLARATAGQISASFISVGISDVLDMWVGNSERNLRSIFQTARNNRPCVLFFDEVDALGARRSDMRGSATRQLINLFLAELDGVDVDNDGLLILGATNAPWHMDAAFRRPGRFDRVLFVPPPDAQGRAEILKVLLRGKPIRDLQYDQIAKKTDRFSGADLKAVVDLAIEAKLQSAMRTGVPEPLTTADLLAVVKRTKPTTHEWFATARNHAIYSNDGGMYDDVLRYLKL